MPTQTATATPTVADRAMASSPGSGLDPRAARLATDVHLASLWRAVHRRLEATGGSLDSTAVTLRDLSDDERRAVDLLLGARRRAAAPRVVLVDLDDVLRQRAGAGLAEVVAAAAGPIRDLPAERAAVAEADDRAWRAAEEHGACARHPALVAWLSTARSTGRVARLGEAGHVELRRALDVLARLPVSPPIGRPALAATVLGDAHALDDDRPAARLVLSALDALEVDAAGSDVARPGAARHGTRSAGERRRSWLAAGVLPDEVSSTALTLGLRPVAVGPATDAARRWAEGRLPLPLPLAAMVAERWVVGSTEVFVCENPSVLSMAAATIGDPPPMVCVEGNPSLAVQELLGQLREGGARLRYHGDFGAGGIAIGNVVIERLGAEPWRFGSRDHAEALARLADGAAALRPLKARIPEAVWDDELGPAIRACGVEVEEEHVMDVLLGDLGSHRIVEGEGG